MLIPVFNDWESAALLLRMLDRELAAAGRRARVLLVDDGSPTPMHGLESLDGLPAITRVDVLGIRRNLGHQRAIAVGLAFAEAKTDCAAVVIMDGDGEDAPRDVPRLLDKLEAGGGRSVVFAQRVKRSESLTFRAFYALFKIVHYALTGIRVRVGNFSVVPRSALSRLVVVSELWNHYAAAVHKARLPIDMIPTHREKRLTGRSQMNFTALVIHGLGAVLVFKDRVGVRILMLNLIGVAATLLLLLAAVGIRFGTHLAIPGWATQVVGFLLLMLLQMLVVAVIFVFIIVGDRDTASFIPLRDYTYFVGEVQMIFNHE